MVRKRKCSYNFQFQNFYNKVRQNCSIQRFKSTTKYVPDQRLQTGLKHKKISSEAFPSRSTTKPKNGYIFATTIQKSKSQNDKPEKENNIKINKKKQYKPSAQKQIQMGEQRHCVRLTQ